jgi:hypothetical protein
MSSTLSPKVLDGWMPRDDFATEVKKHPRSVKRWCDGPDGLPFAYFGKTPFIHVETARSWMLSRLRRPNARRNTERTKAIA